VRSFWKCRREGVGIGSVQDVTVASLAKGILALVALLIIVGLLGGIGSVELLVWLALMIAWIGWWLTSRRKPSPRQ
jgi:hypothetical protein